MAEFFFLGDCQGVYVFGGWLGGGMTYVSEELPVVLLLW